MYKDPSVGNLINIVIVKLIVVHNEQVGAGGGFRVGGRGVTGRSDGQDTSGLVGSRLSHLAAAGEERRTAKGARCALRLVQSVDLL